MKYLKKKKKSPLIPVVCALAVLLLAAVLVLTLLPGHEDAPRTPGQTDTQAGNPVEPTGEAVPETTAPEALVAPDVHYVPVETPYCILNFPKQWENYLDVTVLDELPCRVIFSCKLAEDRVYPLFEIGFNSPEGQIQGAITTDGVNAITVSYLPYETQDQSRMNGEEWAVYTAMQECANDLIGRIPFANEVSGTGEDVTIETPYVTFTFPGRYRDYLYVETDETQGYTLHFYAQFPDGESARIFSLTISDQDIGGVPLLQEDGSKIWIQVDRPDLRTYNLRQDHMTTALFMQEQLRVVMESAVNN